MKLFGAALVAAPLLLLTAYMVRESGWRVAMATWLIVSAVVASISVGAWLLAH